MYTVFVHGILEKIGPVVAPIGRTFRLIWAELVAPESRGKTAMEKAPSEMLASYLANQESGEYAGTSPSQSFRAAATRQA